MLFKDFYIFLEFEGGDADLDEGDPSHYMYITRGTVAGSDEQDQKVLAGCFRLTYIDVCAAMNAQASVFDIFDCTQETCDYFSAIFDIETLGPSSALNHLSRRMCGQVMSSSWTVWRYCRNFAVTISGLPSCDG